VRAEAENLSLHEQCEARLGSLCDQLRTRLDAASPGIECTQGRQRLAQSLRAASQGFGALAGDFRLHGGELFLFYAQQLSSRGDPMAGKPGEF
jgi:hypothetical protein